MRTAVFLVALIATPAAADDAISLKWSLKDGDKFFAKDESVMNMAITVMGQTQDIKLVVTVVERFKIVAAKQDSTTVELTILSLDIEGGMGIPGLSGIGERVRGASIGAVLDENMTVTKLQGYDKFIDKISNDDEKTRKEMKQQFSELSVNQMFSDVFSFGTTKPVKVGDTWPRTEKMTFGGIEASVKMKYKLDSISGAVAKMSYTGEPTFKAGKDLPGLPEGFDIDSMEMKAEKFTGTVTFDPKTGRVTETTQDATVSGKVGLSVGGQKLDMTMKIKDKTKVTISEKSPIKD